LLLVAGAEHKRCPGWDESSGWNPGVPGDLRNFQPAAAKVEVLVFAGLEYVWMKLVNDKAALPLVAHQPGLYTERKG